MSIPIYIGFEEKMNIPFKVLEYSIQKTASKSVNIIKLDGGASWIEKPNPYVGTGFSLLRWDIPRRQNYKGFAIYLDGDIVVLDDIVQLFKCDIKYPNENCSHWTTYQSCKWYSDPTPETSVMLIDCAKAKHNQPDLQCSLDYIEADPEPAKRQRYVRIMRAMKHEYLPQRIPNSFNRLNALDPKGENHILHYTTENTQPWYFPNHPERKIFEQFFKECIDNDLITKEEIKMEIKRSQPHTKSKRGQGLNPYYKKYL